MSANKNVESCSAFINSIKLKQVKNKVMFGMISHDSKIPKQEKKT